jgi:putative flippase GtrA
MNRKITLIPTDVYVIAVKSKYSIKKLLKLQYIRYLLIGGTAYVFEIACLLGLQKLGLGKLGAVSISFWLGLLVAFFAQKIITFSNKTTDYKNLKKQTLGYALLVGWNFCFTLAMTWLLKNILPVIVIRTIVILIVTIWNYAIYKRLFKYE